ncbi:MAG TPA: tetratricopeptide repeat protein [Terriglobales bacterium]|nr:tetratricopeptide repeat protein [Terriglobales bacterium]
MSTEDTDSRKDQGFVTYPWEAQLSALMDRSDYDQALTLLGELRGQKRSEDELYRIHFSEAICLRELGRFEEALHVYEVLKKENEDYTFDRCVCLQGEAKCFEGLKDFREARRRLRQIPPLDAEEEFALDLVFMEINLQFAEGTAGKAIDTAMAFLVEQREALSDPEYVDRTYRLELLLASELVDDGQYHRARDLIRRVLPRAKQEDRALLYLCLGVAYGALGVSSEAIKSYQQALREDADKDLLAQAHYHLGAQYLKDNDAAQAKQHFLETEHLGLPDDIPPSDLYRFLAQACAYLGEVEERDRYTRLASQSNTPS